MKRYLFFILFMTAINDTHIMTPQDNKSSLQQNELSLHDCYFIFKELCKTPLYACFMDYKKVKNSQIACCTCNNNIDSISLWAYSILEIQEQLLKDFMLLANNGSKEEITSFFLMTYQELEIPCNLCKKYNGYYIPEEQKPSQN